MFLLKGRRRRRLLETPLADAQRERLTAVAPLCASLPQELRARHEGIVQVLLAEKHYVDFAGKLSSEDIARLLEVRAKRKEMSYEEYEFRYLPALRATADELVRRGTCRSVSDAYQYQAHHNLQFDLSVPTR